MPLQNRVTPLGDLIATNARGLVYGNRGCLHDAEGRIRRRYQVKRWIACRLVYKDWHRSPLLQPGKFTELFFLDEATALAAGHRPCALCRHEDYIRFAAAWRGLHGDIGADAIDVRLHEERFDAIGRARRLHAVSLDRLPDRAFVLHDGTPHLVLGTRLLPWAASVRVGGRASCRRGDDADHAVARRAPSGWRSALPLSTVRARLVGALPSPAVCCHSPPCPRRTATASRSG